MAEPKTYLMTVTGTASGPPSLSEAAKQIGVDVSHLSASFGVVPIDAAQQLYAVEVDAARVPPSSPAEPYRGPFANPRIGPLGPAAPGDRKPDPDN